MQWRGNPMTDQVECFEVIEASDRRAWLHNRGFGIGGSDAAAVVGLNPYKSNVELFEEKTGRVIPEDISDKPYVRYGIEAEDHIRALFALDYPEYEVTHHDHRILRSRRWPFMQASLDGELVDRRTGRKGILEIKTTSILQSMQREKWKDQIPDNYFCQALHYLLVTGWDFVILRAHLRSEWGEDRSTSVRHYHIEREDVLPDLDYLLAEEIKFWRFVEAGKQPPRVIPGL